MRRSSVLSRRWYYVKRRNEKGLFVFLRLTLLFGVVAALMWVLGSRLVPYLSDYSEQIARQEAADAVQSAVSDTFAGDFSYSDLIKITRDSSGDITSVETQVARLNALSAGIAERIRRKLDSPDRKYIQVPLGALLGKSIFAGSGPKIRIGLAPCDSVETGIQSELSDAGINQTKHSLYLSVKIRMKLLVPVLEPAYEFDSRVVLADTIIVGKVPGIYAGSAR